MRPPAFPSQVSWNPRRLERAVSPDLGSDNATVQFRRRFRLAVIAARAARPTRRPAGVPSAFPEARGFSPRNLRYMKSFAEAWPDFPMLQAPLATLPWCHLPGSTVTVVDQSADDSCHRIRQGQEGDKVSQHAVWPHQGNATNHDYRSGHACRDPIRIAAQE